MRLNLNPTLRPAAVAPASAACANASQTHVQVGVESRRLKAALSTVQSLHSELDSARQHLAAAASSLAAQAEPLPAAQPTGQAPEPAAQYRNINALAQAAQARRSVLNLVA